MILAAEGRKISMARLDDLTYRHGRQLTWSGAAMLAMKRFGFDIREIVGIGELDYRSFIRDGNEYLRKLWRPSVFSFENRHTDLRLQRKVAAQIVPYVIQRPATMHDMVGLFNDGWYVVARVNLHALNGKRGFAGHWLLVTAIRKSSLVVHDPGLPARLHRRLTDRQFLQGFLYTVSAFRPKKFKK